jgi:acetyl esterase/lipase
LTRERFAVLLSAMKAFLPAFFASLLGTALFAQDTNTPPASANDTNSVIALWPGETPNALGNAEKDVPTLTRFIPEEQSANGSAMIICPGGAYGALAPHEGRDYARWLSGHGITCFVLKYRLGTDGYHYPVQLQDVTRAIRLVRSRAAVWKLNPNRIGIIGSSAGGHLASLAMTRFDAGNSNATDVVERESSRPDIAVLCYPVITMGKFAHAGSKKNLLGPNAQLSVVDEASTELHVSKGAPPCFIWSTDEDTTVPIENSLEFAAALRKASVPFELHVYQHGKHGQGLGSKDYDPSKWLPWVAECTRWLKEQGFVN